MKEAPKKIPKNREERSNETRRKFFSVLFMAVWVFASVVVAQLAVGYLMLWILGKDDLSKPVWTAVYSAMSYLIALGLIILVPPKLFKKWGTSREELGLSNLPTWTDIGLGPVGFIVSTLLAGLLVFIFSLFPWFNAEEAQNVGFNIYMSGGERVIAFFTLVVVAPIAEEIIFRGWLYGKVRAKFSAPISILIVSILFGAVHMQWNVGVNVFAVSIVLCCLREITGTIYAGILTHMIKNGVAFYLLYILGA